MDNKLYVILLRKINNKTKKFNDETNICLRLKK